MRLTKEINNLKKILSDTRRIVEIAERQNWSSEKILALREEAHKIWKLLENLEKRKK